MQLTWDKMLGLENNLKTKTGDLAFDPWCHIFYIVDTVYEPWPCSDNLFIFYVIRPLGCHH